MRKIRCSRCFLHKSIRTVNLLVNALGALIIVYALWLLKEWELVADAEYSSSTSSQYSPLPQPWFIYTLLSLGIVICLSTLFGHAVVNSKRVAVLITYIFFVSTILLLQIGVILFIFFAKDWAAEIMEDYEGQHAGLKYFVRFHLYICRCVGIIILLAQACVDALAIVLWVVGPEGTICCNDSRDDGSTRHTLVQSFLVNPDSAPLIPASYIEALRKETLRNEIEHKEEDLEPA